MIVADFPKRYLTDEEVVLLSRNPEYNLWVKEGKRCRVCGGDGTESGTFRYEEREHVCPQDDYGHIAIQKAKFYWLSNIPSQYQELPFYDGNDPIRRELDNYIEKYRFYAKNGVGLTFYSRLNGTGKTWAATYVLKQLVKQGYDGWFERFYRVKGFHDIEDLSERTFLRKKVSDTGLLVLDEVMRPISVNQRNLFSEKLEELIRPRQDMNFPTIVTTNLTPEELEIEYPRSFSLLSAKNIEIPMPELVDVRTGDGIFMRNVVTADSGEVCPIT